MDPSGLRVISFIKFPPITIYDIQIDSYLTRYYSRQVESGVHDVCSLTAQVELCQRIVNLASTIILDAIRPVISHWHRQVPQLYTHVKPEQCFFGIDEADVLTNMTIILPHCFRKPSPYIRGVNCESLKEFIHIVAREVTQRINSRIAPVLNSYMPTQPPIYECNCISFTTLDTMIALLNQILKCHDYCKCTPLRRCSQNASSTSTLHAILAKEKLHRSLLRQGLCNVLYYTSNKAIQDILSEITEFTRPAFDDEYEGWDEGGDYLTSTCSFNWTLSDDTNISVDDDRRSGSDELQHFDSTDSQDCQLEDFSRPSSETFVASPFEGESSDPPADSQDTESTEEADRLNEVVLFVLARLLLLTTKMARKPLCREDVVAVLTNLSVKALRAILPADIINSNSEVVKAYKDVFRDLYRKFGSAKVLLQAMTSQDLAAEAVIIQTLKIHLTAHAPRQKNAFVRFFRSVGKVMKKPFAACLRRRTKT